MTTKEAIQAMLDGKKLTSTEWSEGEFIYFDGECFREEDGHPTPLSDISQLSKNLKIYEEPKPKQTVVIERWLCKYNDYYAVKSTSNIDAFLKEAIYVEKVALLSTDTYEVEI